jgi:hypothetical protein
MDRIKRGVGPVLLIPHKLARTVRSLPPAGINPVNPENPVNPVYSL